MSEQLRLSDQVISEVSLLKMLNVEKPTLDGLRLEKGLPFVRLSTKCRVYLANEVLDWLRQYNKKIQ